MYALKNKVQLIGNLGNAPEVKTIESGKKLARFSVATNESYRNATGEKVTETTWHNLVAWGKVAEIAEKFLHNANHICLLSRLHKNVCAQNLPDEKFLNLLQQHSHLHRNRVCK